MNQVAQVIMFLAVIHDIFLLTMAIMVCRKHCQASSRKKLDPPQLSSDEEDDAEFLRRDREGPVQPAEESSDEFPDFDPRNILISQIRDIISTNSRRRNLLGSVANVERRLLDATH